MQSNAPKLNKAQSAMEYLMSYGWAILIVAVIIIALYELGVFNLGGSTACVANLGYTCTNPSYNSNAISFRFGQNAGVYYYCTNALVVVSGQALNTSGIPEGFNSSNVANIVSLGTIASGETTYVNFNALQSGGFVTNAPVGTLITGNVWLRYYANPSCAAPAKYIKVASLSMKESSSLLVTPLYLLNQFASPLGGGSVSPGTGLYAYGSSIPIKANAITGYTFNGWACTGAGCYKGASTNALVVIYNNITETAIFKLNTTSFTLNTIANASQDGRVSPTNSLQNANSVVTISAFPNTGYTFYNWVGSGLGSYTGNTNPASVTMNGPITEIANFEPVGQKTFLLNMSVNPAGAGTVSPDNALETANDIYTILANANTGYVFKNWTATGAGNYIGTNNPGSITMNGNITETANFNLNDIPITLTNTQSSATSPNFQQMLVIDSHNYADFIKPSWTNVEFSTGPRSGTVLSAWVESGNSNTSTDTIVWVNMGSDIIAANSNTVIYMDFESSNVMSASGPTGEAPQLSCTSPGIGCTPYASYDNGGSVFTNYQNFDTNGCTAPSGWFDGACSNGCSYVSFDHGFEIGAVNGCGWVYLGSNFPINSATDVDVNIQSIQTNTAGNWQEAFVNSASSGSWSPQGAAVGWADNYACNGNDEGATFELTSSAAGSSLGGNSNIFPPDVVTVTNSEVYSNYTAEISGSGILSSSGYVDLASYTTNDCGASFNGYWVRTRVAPPNGVMPTVSYGV